MRLARQRRPTWQQSFSPPYRGNFATQGPATMLNRRILHNQRVRPGEGQEGVSVTGADTYDQILTADGPGQSLQANLNYSTGVTALTDQSDSLGNFREHWIAAGAVVRLTFMPVPVDFDASIHRFARIAEGRFDAVWDGIGSRIASYDRVIVAPGWEINENWYPWGFRIQDAGVDRWNYAGVVDDYVAAFRRIVGRIRALAPRARFEWNFVGSPSQPPAATTWAWYPGDDVVDLLALQIYTRDWWTSGAQQQNGVQNQFQEVNINATYPVYLVSFASAARFCTGVGPEADAARAAGRLRNGKKPLNIGETGTWGVDNPFHAEAYWDWVAARVADGTWYGGSWFDITIHDMQKTPRLAAVWRRRNQIGNRTLWDLWA
jgi:hypothetical protein